MHRRRGRLLLSTIARSAHRCLAATAVGNRGFGELSSGAAGHYWRPVRGSPGKQSAPDGQTDDDEIQTAINGLNHVMGGAGGGGWCYTCWQVQKVTQKWKHYFMVDYHAKT